MFPHFKILRQRCNGRKNQNYKTINSQNLKTNKMKKLLFAIMAGLLPALVIPNKTSAQSFESIASAIPMNNVYKNGNTKAVVDSKTIELSMVNPKALKNFRKVYKVHDEKWSTGKDCIAATYGSKDIACTVYFDKKGHWVGSLKTYHENKLAKNIKTMILQGYDDYEILTVHEVETMAASVLPIYIVTIQNDKNMKLIRVQGEYMDVYKEYRRSPGL